MSNQKALFKRALADGVAPTTAFASVPLILLLPFGLVCSLVCSLPFLFPQLFHVLPPRLGDERRRCAVMLAAGLGSATDSLCNLGTRLVTCVGCWEVWRPGSGSGRAWKPPWPPPSLSESQPLPHAQMQGEMNQQSRLLTCEL